MILIDDPGPTRTPDGDEEWWPDVDDRHLHRQGARQVRHTHAGGRVGHRWAEHTEAEADAVPWSPIDPLMAAQEWLDVVSRGGGGDTAGSTLLQQAIDHLDALVRFIRVPLRGTARDVEIVLGLNVGGRTAWMPDTVPELRETYARLLLTFLGGDDETETTPPSPPTESPRQVQIRVEYTDNSCRWYPVAVGGGWRVDAATRLLVVGRGLDRIMVPLDQVRAFSPEEVR